MRALILATTILTAFAATARAQSTATQDPAPVGSTGTAPIGQFNGPGTLTAVTSTLNSTLTGSIGVENLQAAPAAFAGMVSTTTTVTTPLGDTLVSTTNAGGGSATLGAYDGKTDFSGASGRTFTLSNTSSATTTLVVGAPGGISLAPFVGSGTVPLGYATSGGATISAPLNVAAKYVSAIGANLSVSYSSTASASAPGSTFGSIGITSGGSTGTVGLFNPLFVTTTTQTRSVAPATTGYTAPLTFSKFDPALGLLEAVNLSIGGTLATALLINDGSAIPGAYSLTQALALGLLGPDGTLLDTARASIGRSGTVDGTPDITTNPLSGTAAAVAATYTGPFAAFEGAGNLTLFANAVGTLNGTLPASVDLTSGGTAGATVTLSYTYLPAAFVPEPGALTLGLTALGLLATRRRQG